MPVPRNITSCGESFMKTRSNFNVGVVQLVLALLVAPLFVGCSSTHEEGVSSNMRKQWQVVGGDVKTTTDAAKAVLEEEGLKDITASNTSVDGKASGKKADGTTIDITVTKKSEATSEVTALVGTMGSPTYGAEIVKKIRDRVEKK